MIRYIITFLFLILFFSALHAGTTGKITGIITDKQSGEPLPGVNIQVDETALGAATDIYGYYVILNVPVGAQQLNISYIGYKPVSIMNLKINADGTTRIDYQLESQILEVDEAIEITAERELIQIDNTASLTAIPAELISTQPIDNITQTVSLTAGFTEGSFRGGRVGTGEVKYMLDGVDVSSPIASTTRGFNPGQVDDTGFDPQRETSRTVGLATDIPESAVEEVQVITGGMGPEYDAKSAVVNVITKSNPNAYSGFARLRMTPSLYGNGTIIPHRFGQVSGFMTDEEAIAEAKMFGTGSLTNNERQYASPSKAFVNPDYRRYEASLGGPIPLQAISGRGRMSFNINLDIFDQGGFFRGQNLYQETVFAKWTYQTASAETFSLNLLSSRREQQYWRHGDSRIVTTGDTVYDYVSGEDTPYWFLIGSVVHPDGRLAAVKDFDMLRTAFVPKSSSHLWAFSYKNVVSSKTFYEINISRFQTSQKIRVNDPATGRPLGIDDFAEFRFQQPLDPRFFPEGANHAIDLADSYYAVQPMWIYFLRQDDEQIVWNFNGDLRSQLNEFNELHLGIAYKSYYLKMNYQSGSAGNATWINNYNVQPEELALFISDKIETAGMIINAGLRYDYFNPQAILPEDFSDPVKTEAKNPSETLYWDVNASAEDRIKNPKQARSRSVLMPRLGISFPITELDVIHINYGHYFAPPAMGELYDNYTWSLSSGHGYAGNPDLQPEKTILYEAGIEHGFNHDVKLRATLFYKDIADLTNMKLFRDPLTGDPYWIKINADYANVSGFELSLITRRWHYLLAQMYYTYQIAMGKSSDNTSAADDSNSGRILRTESYPLDWDVRHTFTANIDFRLPADWLGSSWLGDWGVSIILSYNSGRPWTSPRQPPPPATVRINDQRYPAWLNVDTRFFKNFRLYKQIRLGVFLEIFNLFNDRTLRRIINGELYLKGLDEGDGLKNTPYAWALPRHARLGFEIIF